MSSKRMGYVLPERLMQKCCYSVLFQPDFSALYVYRLKGNDVYAPDPQVTGANETVAGFNLFAPLYRSWVVMGSKIRVTVRNTTTSTSDSGGLHGQAAHTMTAVLKWDYQSGEPAGISIADLSETTFTKTKSIGISAGGHDTKYLSQYMTTNKVYGYPSRKIKDDENFWGNSITGPANSWYWKLFLGMDSQDPTNINATAAVRIKIIYYTCLFGRLNYVYT